jgi:hypothetical protein
MIMKTCKECGTYRNCWNNKFVRERRKENCHKNTSAVNPICWHPKGTITILKEKHEK